MRNKDLAILFTKIQKFQTILQATRIEMQLRNLKFHVNSLSKTTAESTSNIDQIDSVILKITSIAGEMK